MQDSCALNREYIVLQEEFDRAIHAGASFKELQGIYTRLKEVEYEILLREFAMHN